MDFVIDDIESMKMELTQWEEEAKKQSEYYEIEKNKTDGELQGLHQRLTEIDAEIGQIVNCIFFVEPENNNFKG